MATALQQKLAAQAKLVAAQRVMQPAATSSVILNEDGTDATSPLRTFVHQVAGANVIMEDGRKLTFYGKTSLASKGQAGGAGYYITDVPEEVELLAGIARMPSSQVTELVEDEITHREKLVYKRVDPAIQQSADDAAKNSERVFNPQVSAAVENLGAHVASGMAADNQQ